MTLNRRHILFGALAVTAMPRFSLAELRVGEATLVTVSDGHLVLPGGAPLPGVPADEHDAILARHGVAPDRREPPCNVTLYRDGARTVLFDVGGGSEFLPSVGRLLDNLDAAGVAPEDVTDVLFTHAHPDHVWGLLDDFGDVAFPNARFQIGRTEWDYWIDPETLNLIGEARLSFAVGAQRRLGMIEDRIEFFDDGDEVLPGIAAIATFGHTPGHMSFEIANGGDTATVIGDAVINHHVAFERPAWPAANDQDPDLAAATRTVLLDRLAADRSAIVGFHLPDGGMGHVERQGDGFRFAPLGS